MIDRTPEEILEQAVYAVACVAYHYGTAFNEDGLAEVRALLSNLSFRTDTQFREQYGDEPYIDFHERIIWPSGWNQIPFEKAS